MRTFLNFFFGFICWASIAYFVLGPSDWFVWLVLIGMIPLLISALRYKGLWHYEAFSGSIMSLLAVGAVIGHYTVKTPTDTYPDIPVLADVTAIMVSGSYFLIVKLLQKRKMIKP